MLWVLKAKSSALFVRYSALQSDHVCQVGVRCNVKRKLPTVWCSVVKHAEQMLLNLIRPINITGKPDDFWHRPTMVHCASWLLALGAIVVVFSTSNALFWRRRRRRCSAVSCRVSSWSSWSSCSRTCGSGVKTRTRTKTRSASCGGTCPYDFTDTKRCNSNCCPVNCVYSWGSWSSCSGCGMSTHSRSSTIYRYSRCNGNSCPSRQTRSCNTYV